MDVLLQRNLTMHVTYIFLGQILQTLIIDYQELEMNMLLALNIDSLSWLINSQFPKVLMSSTEPSTTPQRTSVWLFGDDHDYDQVYWSYCFIIPQWYERIRTRIMLINTLTHCQSA
jgi:hypothetical protein